MDNGWLVLTGEREVRLTNINPGSTGKFENRQAADKKLTCLKKQLIEYQEMLWAGKSWAVLVILQSMDTGGKDGIIKHVFSGLNPLDVEVTNFRAPSREELAHDYLWRAVKALPERGKIGIFNRSHYEEVIVVRVHPELLAKQNLPLELCGKDVWERRYEEIRGFEKFLVNNGIIVLKFFLHMSREEQKRRFLRRIRTPDKQWKFSAGDIKEREHWGQYMDSYEAALNQTASEYSPWFVIPADHKWFSRLAVAQIVVKRLSRLNLSYPALGEEEKRDLLVSKALLDSEDRKKKINILS